MVQAPVGWHCHQCVRRSARQSPVVRYRPGFGAVPRARQAPVTMALIFINVFLFLAAAASSRLTFDSYIIPVFMTHFGQSYRLVASFFVTHNILDVALNMWCLYIIGRLVEPTLGKWRYLALYMLCGLGGSVAYYLIGNPQQPAAGASGAIFGVLVAFGVLYPNQTVLMGFLFPIKAKYMVMIYAAIELLLTFGPNTGVSTVAHLGGMAFGYLYLKRRMPSVALPDVRGAWRQWRLSRAKRKFQVYMRKHGNRDPWSN